jgi:hypothetical protein
MRLILQLAILFTCTIVSADAFAQAKVENADSIAGKFISALRSDNREKLYVQTNKWFFAAGEDIWFKAWIVNIVSHKFYSRSKTLFVDLVDERDTSISQMLLNIPSQQTEGHIALPASLPEGYYWLRVYTADMIKHNMEGIFVTPLYVLNNRYPSKLNADPSLGMDGAINNNKPSISFYPEGGALISGTNTTVGIRVANKNGRSLAMDGYITDARDSVVAKFKTDETGLGACNFYVYKSRQYTAHANWNNQLLQWPLPAISQYSSQIAIKDQNNYNISAVVSVGDSLYRKGRPSYLIGISRDSICFASAGTDMYEVNIPKNNFPEGLARLLLFNEKAEVVSERAIFIKKPKPYILIEPDKDHYNKRDRVLLNMIIGDSLSHPELSALSISVTDDSLVQEPAQAFTNPLYNTWDTSSNVSDLELLAQPSIFTGKNYMNSFASNQQHILKTVNETDSNITDIKGRILNRKKEPVPSRIVTLYSKKGINIFDTDTTDANGQFHFHLPPYPDSVEFTLQVTNKKGLKTDEKIVIDIKSPFPSFATPVELKRKLSIKQTEQVKRFRYEHLDNLVMGTGKEWLKEVIVVGKRKDASYNTSKRVSNFSIVVTGENLQKLNPNDASTALLTVPGLHLRGGFLTLGGFNSFGASAKDEPLLVVDGVMIPQDSSPALETGGRNGPVMGLSAITSPLMAQIQRIPPDVIDFIEVLKGPEAAYYGTYASNGVILINTHRKSNYASHYENYGTLVYLPKSYHLAPLFSMPDYSNPALKKAIFNDVRSTLYWNGHVYSNPNGKASIEFYTGDPITSYTISVTGITASGTVFYKKLKIKTGS